MKNLLLLFLCLLPPSLLQAGYSNPTLKIQILNTSHPFSVTTQKGFTFTGPGGLSKKNSIIVVPLGHGVMRIKGIIKTRRPVLLHSSRLILVRQAGHRVRKYHGDVELVPYQHGVYVINHIQTESYLEGVLEGEIQTRWPMAAVKAQVVIARTYALYRRFERKKSLWHLVAGTADQVYLGARRLDKRARLAIKSTRGVVVSYQGRLAQTFYHSNCGGMTEDPGVLWNYSLPYYPIIEVPYGMDDPLYYWEVRLNQRQLLALAKKIGLKLRQVTSLQVSQRSQSGRAYRVEFNGQGQWQILAKDFRRLLGYSKVKSLMFDLSWIDGGVLVTGQGNGHGVGLCQWAAKEMAEKGYSYQEILHFFYRPTDLGYYGG